jgi:hypothetical protein
MTQVCTVYVWLQKDAFSVSYTDKLHMQKRGSILVVAFAQDFCGFYGVHQTKFLSNCLTTVCPCQRLTSLISAVCTDSIVRIIFRHGGILVKN